ncbi:MAG: FIST N-terminal domain-containing protein [Pseudomonadota bacterium]
MKIDVFAENGTDLTELGNKFDAWLATHDRPADFVAIHKSVGCRPAKLTPRLEGVTAVHGATSCLGVMSDAGPRIQNGAGAFAIWDDAGDYGTAMRPFEHDPRASARNAVEAALLAADRPSEAPDLIWLSSSPGHEEAVLAGIEDVVGGNVPIMGGSAADDTVAGEWLVYDSEGSASAGVVISVLFPSTKVSFAYHNGYAPTPRSGIVTAADGRLLKAIDDRPAADVYREWVGEGVIPDQVNGTTAILSESTLSPLGQYLDSVGDVPYYLLSHPASLTPEGHLELFADVEAGDQLTLMNGSPDQLTRRAGKVAALAAQSGSFQPDELAGALMVYCGGCMLAVRDRLDDVTSGVTEALPDVPFLGIFTFGEQGVVLDGRNRHGNLMISAILFGA